MAVQKREEAGAGESENVRILDLLRRPEGKTLEFKRDLSSPEKVLTTLIAFANCAGGTVAIGVEDKSRRVRGVDDALAMEERLASLIADGIAPLLAPEIEVLPWRRTQILAVRVYPSSSRPHYLKARGPETGVFVRVGSTNRRADPAMIAELRRSARLESFDEQALPDFNSEALDFRVASELFSGVRRLAKGDLQTLRLLTRHQGRLVPTVGGMILFGRDRLRAFPDAWIQAGRFGGTDRARIDDHAEFQECPIQAIEHAIAFVQGHIRRAAEIGPVRRVDRWQYPPAALREAIINAVAHADYSQGGAPIRVAIFDDRMEIENPGLLPFGLTVEEIRQGVSILRNRVIGRVFRELGLIEQWGSGIQRMMSACREAGLPEPQFEEIGTHFRVTLFSQNREQAPALDAVEQSIVNALRGSGGLTTQGLADRIGLSARATRTRVLSLVQRGVVVEIGKSSRDPKKTYHLAETA
ncbi:MAG: helix-turn-helix domain-containing protein [Candidatus Sumerlaeota bacterium]|nr:helix-turn-helix domain-containing protein [Candidatus Sumerlaeota bacterium]